MDASAWSTASTKLAAVFAGLGFVVSCRETEIAELNSRLNLRHFVGQTSQWRRHLDRDWLRSAWENGSLEKEDPLHPFLQGLRAVRCYDQLLRYQARGERLRLRPVAGGRAWEYEPGEEDSRMTLARRVHEISDLPLAAALATVGVPVIDLLGQAPKRKYLLPAEGLDPAGSATAELIRRAEPGKLDLQLERDQPEHPLCAAYQASYAYAALNAHIKRLERNIVIKAPHSNRRAYISERAPDRILDQVARHFRIHD